jgi:FkbM family methyltransferase
VSIVDQEELLRLVDVGALGGVQKKWSPHLDRLWPILFEPNPHEVEHVRQATVSCPRSTVVCAALAHKTAIQDLYVTKNPTCVSLLEPNSVLLGDYGIRVHFEIVGNTTVECTRYDTLYHRETVPLPDAIKIDVQGFEYEVLLGFGDLLDQCLGIELESHFYPLYRNQKLLYEVIDLLSSFDLVLRRLDANKMHHFDGDLIEVDAYFTKRRKAVRNLSPIQQSKFDLITKVWELPVYDL